MKRNKEGRSPSRRDELAVVLAAVAAAISCGPTAPAGDEELVATGLDVRPVPRSCQGFERRGSFRLARAFPRVSVDQAVQLVRDPDAAAFYLVEQGGTIRRFAAVDDARTELVADLRDLVRVETGEDGLLGIALAPDFATSRELVLKYTAPAAEAPGVRVVLARAKLDASGAFTPADVRPFLEVPRPQPLHHGGPPQFGPDDLLYVPMGDGGLEPTMRAQDLSSLEGKVLRLDLRASPYAVPRDNPFVTTPGARPEIFAYGLRNPFGWSFDPSGRALWVGDVGYASYEEIDRVVAGGNYGWPIREGKHCRDGAPCSAAGLIDPVHEYVNQGGSAIVVGKVYRGKQFPELAGHVVFGDFIGGRIEALDARTPDYGTRHLVDSGLTISALTDDADGEILIVDFSAGIFRLERNPEQRPVPVSLRETGCVDVERPGRAPEGLVPYDVNMPFWTDATTKARWMAVPRDKQIRILEDQSFELPVGSVVVKSFFVRGRPLETRLLVRHDDGDWAGYSFEWNADGSDAVLLDGRKDVTVDGLAWSFPSRAQCLSCHTTAAGRTLGLDTPQLNGPFTYPTGRRANQMRTLEHIGMFETSPADPALLPRFPRRDDVRADDGAWARAYLHANCSHCHRPGGPGGGSVSFSYTAGLAAAGCDAPPELEGFGVASGRIVAPSQPDASILLRRMRDPGPTRMPPIGIGAVDDVALGRIERWIAQTRSCE